MFESLFQYQEMKKGIIHIRIHKYTVKERNSELIFLKSNRSFQIHDVKWNIDLASVTIIVLKLVI